MTKLVLVVVLVILAFLAFIIIFVRAPVELGISETTCITKSCFIAQKVSLNLKVKPSGFINISNITIESDAIEPSSIKIEKTFISTSKKTEIPISFSIKDSIDEGKYKISFKIRATSDLKYFLWIIKSMIFGNDVVYTTNFDVRYPRVEFKVEEPKTTPLQKIYDIHLMNKDNIKLKCKIRIKLSPDVLLKHDGFTKISENEKERVYESQFEFIEPTYNSKCCNSIEVNANTMRATAQINLIPVCEIDRTEVVIKPQINQRTWTHNKADIGYSSFSYF